MVNIGDESKAMSQKLCHIQDIQGRMKILLASFSLSLVFLGAIPKSRPWPVFHLSAGALEHPWVKSLGTKNEAGWDGTTWRKGYNQPVTSSDYKQPFLRVGMCWVYISNTCKQH